MIKNLGNIVEKLKEFSSCLRNGIEGDLVGGGGVTGEVKM